MKKLLLPAVILGLLCVALASWPAGNPHYYIAAYAGLSACAGAAIILVEKQWRWLATLAFLFGVMGIYFASHRHTLGPPITNPNQAKLPGAPGWIQWSSTRGGNDHWYALTPSATDWDTAEKLAVSCGGTLATITGAQEQIFVNDSFLTGEFEHRPVWIGLIRFKTPASTPYTRGSPTFVDRVRLALWDLGFHGKGGAAHDDEFSWVTGEDLEYSNWKSGEPNNMPPGESWVAINWEYSESQPRGAKGDWNDTPLNGTTGYGGNTSGPYFGLMELGPPPKKSLTPSTWALITLCGLALGTGILFARNKARS